MVVKMCKTAPGLTGSCSYGQPCKHEMTEGGKGREQLSARRGREWLTRSSMLRLLKGTSNVVKSEESSRCSSRRRK